MALLCHGRGIRLHSNRVYLFTITYLLFHKVYLYTICLHSKFIHSECHGELTEGSFPQLRVSSQQTIFLEITPSQKLCLVQAYTSSPVTPQQQVEARLQRPSSPLVFGKKHPSCGAP